ncbi:cytochrome P450 [Phialemonium atrogriseum]|uniref:Cytochrome P450 n=1 Tax=Phialemonium atrogriseum TaxID=1093897 RepID=A0AAJ0BU27_9PEZI|nr:cytochrome P450 [Phialemonium atrogriseum]KAK1764513.1 cytochrome P450 [Phialemonium atrogriseum]
MSHLLGIAHDAVGWTLPHATLCVFALFLIRVVARRWWSPLRQVPGPWLAAYTRLWKLYHTSRDNMELVNIDLHRRYGPIVRIAPHEVSIDDPEDSLRVIYGHGTRFTKSRWYEASDPPGGHSLFTDPDIKRHAHERRMVASGFSMSALLEMEDFVSECVKVFETRMNEFAESGQALDMAHWLQCYAFDVIGEITFAKRFGFMDRGEDVGNTIQTLEGFLSYSAKMGVLPELHAPYSRLKSLLFPGSAPLETVGEFAVKAVEDRKRAGAEHRDLVSRFLQTHEEKPGEFPMSEVYKMCTVMIGAGSDTTAIALRAVVYFLCKNPEKLSKLRSELDVAESDGRLSEPITYAEAMSLPYLQAVLKEAMRLHPSTGFTMARVVPKGGTVLLGHSLPEGTTVGINSWVAHRNEDVFGPDVESFIPERWLRSEEFGSGSRTCLGKNISVMEMSKLIPQLIRHFHIQLVHPDRPWKTTNWWLVKQADMDCYVSQRRKA